VARLSAEAFATAAQENPGGLVVYDVPLLVEAGRKAEFDAVVVVEASDNERLRRLQNVRGLSEGEAESRLAAQATNEQRRAVADFVVSTETSLEETRHEVESVYAQLMGLARVSKG
jgi:dephospho-CoA kinase